MTDLRKLAFATISALTISLGWVVATSGSAQAQQLCLIRDDALDQLTKQYGEEISGRGLTGDGRSMVELLTGQDGSWTIVITDVNGRSCVIGTGEAWTAITPQHGLAS